MNKGDTTEAVVSMTTSKLISLTASSRADDATGKRLGFAGPFSHNQEQPASKKPIAQQDEVPREDRSYSKGRQEREKEIESEVRRSCADIAWAKTPRLEEIDHWFYDLRNAGTEPRRDLFWSPGINYHVHSQDAGRDVMPLEHAHRTFKAVTSGISIAV
jgi:hypothetical protein